MTMYKVREGFLKWWDRITPNQHMYDQLSCWVGWQARQPEIDALKEQVFLLTNERDCSRNSAQYLINEKNALKAENAAFSEDSLRLLKEIVALKAENERLRKDAERYQKVKALDFALPEEITAKNADALIDAMKEGK